MLTDEQQAVIDTVMSKPLGKVIAVNAIAGSGKTSTANAIIEAYKPTYGFYTAYNKAIVEDSNKKFGGKIRCRTLHSIAYNVIKPSSRIEEMNYDTITENIPYSDKAAVISILDNFYRSSSTNIEDYVTNVINENKTITDLVLDYAEKMWLNKIPPTFNYLLKRFHLMLVDRMLHVPYDLFIVDEAQDMSAVALEIFKLVPAKCKVILGDKYQNIYSFMNTVNAFEELKENIIPLYLTKSFRCNSYVAKEIETYGKLNLSQNFKYKGMINYNKVERTAYLSRTNAQLVIRMYELLKQNKKFNMIKHPNITFGLIIALLKAEQGEFIEDKQFRYLQNMYKQYEKQSNVYKNFFEFCDIEVDDIILNTTINIIRRLNNLNVDIFKLKEKVNKMWKDTTIYPILLSTTHAFKGLECDRVYIEDDLNYSFTKANTNAQAVLDNKKLNSIDEIREYLSTEDIENLNTCYVALSRAKSSILNSQF